MSLLSIILLLGPGILCQILNGRYDTESWRTLVKTVLEILVHAFLIAVAVAVGLNMVLGDAVYSFSPVFDIESSLTIYHVNFVSEYACLAIAVAVGIAVAERLISKIGNRIRHRYQSS